MAQGSAACSRKPAEKLLAESAALAGARIADTQDAAHLAESQMVRIRERHDRAIENAFVARGHECSLPAEEFAKGDNR
jgi:hypothetical protein